MLGSDNTAKVFSRKKGHYACVTASGHNRPSSVFHTIKENCARTRLTRPPARNLLVSLGAVLAVANCTAEAPANPGLLHAARPGAMVTATAEPEVADAAAAAARAAGAADRATTIDRAPFLQLSPLGRRFMAASPPRALALGHPGPSCPGWGLAATAADALRGCLAAQPGRPDCGCRVVAMDRAVLAPPEALAYAPGVAGRLLGSGRPPGLLIVEERAAESADVDLVGFYDAGGLVALGALEGDGRARLTDLRDGTTYEGWREPRGWRRGRLTERLLLNGPDHARLIALIGFEPAEIVAEGEALGAWPKGAAKGG
jgi:hypothetical protein